MTAMEARISSNNSADDSGHAHTPVHKSHAHNNQAHAHNNHAHAHNSLPSHSKKEVATITSNATPTKSRRGQNSKKSNNSAAAKAKEAKEKAAAQWQRRKNYDPLKSMAKAKIHQNSRTEYTDESSDVESAASFSHASSIRGAPGPPSNPRVALIRSDAGRHSLRGVKEDPNFGSSGPQSLGSLSGSPVRRPPFRTNVMSQNGGRSTSSLSSKEAEFQVRFLLCFEREARANVDDKFL